MYTCEPGLTEAQRRADSDHSPSGAKKPDRAEWKDARGSCVLLGSLVIAKAARLMIGVRPVNKGGLCFA
ncbi:hypothetical protein DPEC_G00292230 [Dallia pectoralis]|uniref:Uncharacterized protein n=1 Tax=Dallia pectoralis TaxID=75939 RepID=A0ACC2FHX1_DALPE|nr:hypothetical protein DPEC_G00292230 [Dallia pectoralis]